MAAVKRYKEGPDGKLTQVDLRTGGPLKSFAYINSSGAEQNFDAVDAESAIAGAPGIHPRSGVQDLSYTTPLQEGSVTSSSGNARDTEARMGTDISNLSSLGYVGPTNNMKYLDEFDALYKDLYRSAKKEIGATYAEDLKGLEGAHKSEMGSTASTLARAGGFLGESGSGTGVLLNLSSRHRNELTSLESKRQAALNGAREAYAKQSFGLAEARLAEANRYEKEAYARKEKFFEEVNKAQTEQAVFDLIQSGVTDIGEIYNKLNTNTENPTISLDDIERTLSRFAPKGGIFEFSGSDIPKLIGAGFSQDDISGVMEYVNANGYTDELRNSLTARERSILDGVFYPKVATTGIGGTITISEAKTLGLPTSIIGRSEQQIVNDLLSDQPPLWYKEYEGSRSPTDTDDATLANNWQQYRSKVLGQNITGNEFTYGDKAGGGGIEDLDYDSIDTQ